MNDPKSIQDANLPASRSIARILLLSESPDEKTGLHLNGRARAASSMKHVGEVAHGAGHLVGSALHPVLVENDLPEIVVIDGTSRRSLELVVTARTDEKSALATILVLTSAKTRDERLEELHGAGADDFLDLDASEYEIKVRLENATQLARARSEVILLRDKLGRQIRVDDLTGVMSRRFFFQQAHRECARARRYRHKLSCAMLEVDHFKSLVTIFGDAAGEVVLRSVANIIGQWSRDSDLLARFSESKFVLLLPETGIDGAARAQDKISIALKAHRWQFNGQELPISVSIGEAELHSAAAQRGALIGAAGDDISEGDENGETALSTREALAGLLEDADSALYVARKGARMPEIFVPFTPIPPSEETFPPTD